MSFSHWLVDEKEGSPHKNKLFEVDDNFNLPSRPYFSLRLRGGLGWWFGSLGNHCLQHILLKFKVCT